MDDENQQPLAADNPPQPQLSGEDEALFVEDEQLAPSNDDIASTEADNRPHYNTDDHIEWELNDETANDIPLESFDDGNNTNDEFQRRLVIPINRVPPRPTAGSETDVWTLGLPATVELERTPFNPSESRKEELDIKAKGDATAQRQLKAALSTYHIRSYTDDSGQLHTNTRLVEFSDGSSALIVGRKIFEASAREEQGLQTLLLEISETPVCYIHGKVTSKKLFAAPDMAQMRAIMESKTIDGTPTNKTPPNINRSNVLKTKVTTVQHGAESELRLKRHLEEQMAKDYLRNSDNRMNRPAKRKKPTLSADFLEADD